jgi:hypothetical protein
MFPPFPTLMLPVPSVVDPATADYVRIRRVVSKTSGAIGGRQFGYSGWSAPVPCNIKGRKSSDVRTQMREHEVTQYEVTFAEDPGVGLRDQLSWDAAGKILTVTGNMAIGDPTTRAWLVYAEEDA